MSWQLAALIDCNFYSDIFIELSTGRCAEKGAKLAPKKRGKNSQRRQRCQVWNNCQRIEAAAGCSVKRVVEVWKRGFLKLKTSRQHKATLGEPKNKRKTWWYEGPVFTLHTKAGVAAKGHQGGGGGGFPVEIDGHTKRAKSFPNC